MPIYEYECEEHGAFEDIKNISDRDTSICSLCGKICQLKISTNDFMAKKYIPPPAAKRHFGENRVRPPYRKKWV